ncbi:MAG: DUF1552 domain-containing protein [Polyangiaceae bacterium]|nr:DUF1552 domain-containing protein [Polyangiaceae bacterium]
MPKRPISRRQLLRGAACGVTAAVALPILEGMLNSNGNALAGGAPLPLRFGGFFWGNGVRLNAWVPQQTGPGYQLSPLLMPFAPMKDYISIVTGLGVYTDVYAAHFGPLMGTMSGAGGTPQGGLNYAFTRPTMDQVIADIIGTTTRFKSLEFGVAATDASDADFGSIAKAISHNGPNSPNLPEYNAIALYDRIFGDGFGEPGVSDVTIAVRKSVLDLVAEDAKALQARLGATDRQRLEQHLEGINDLEKQLAGGPVGEACPGKPPMPTSSFGIIDGPYDGTLDGQVQWEPLAAAQIELLAYALACDQTRVFTFRFSPCNDYTVYPGFPDFEPDPATTNTGSSMHGMTHEEGGDQPGVQQCVTFSMQNFANMLQRLMDMPEGDGHVLDNCAILGFTDVDEGQTHNYQQSNSLNGLPMVVAGRAGGALTHPGVHYRSPQQGDQPGEGSGRNASVVPLTLMQALGTGITTWGEGPGQATKVIDELLA